MAAGIPTNLLYFGDNLDWLRNPGCFPDESVDLIYLGPPFNSNRNFNVLFKESDVRESEAQIHAFEDTWSWDNEGRVQAIFTDFWLTAPEKPKQMLKALIDALGHNDVTAYLTMMAPRLVELHRVLKSSSSLYLHCDPTASHYLKIILNSIFGPQRFMNEIIWKRTTAHSDTKQGARFFGRVHDVLLLYAKERGQDFNVQMVPYDDSYIASHYRYTEEGSGRRYRKGDLTANKPGGDTEYEWHGATPYRGRYWAYSRENMEEFERQGRLVYTRTGMPEYKRYLDEMPGERSRTFGTIFLRLIRKPKSDLATPHRSRWAC